MTEFIVCQVYPEEEEGTVKLEPVEHVEGLSSEEVATSEQASENFDDTGQDKTIKNANFKVPELQDEEITKFSSSEVPYHEADPINVPSKSKYKQEADLNEVRDNLQKALASIDLCETQLISLQEVYADFVKKSALSQLQSVKETLGKVLQELSLGGQEKKWEAIEVKSEETLSSSLGVAVKLEDFSEAGDDYNTETVIEQKWGRPELEDKEFDLKRKQKETKGKAKKVKKENNPSFQSWACPHCDKVYKESNSQGEKSLERHIERMHTTSFTCKQCDAIFESKRKLTRHARCHAPKIKRLVICTICGAEIRADRMSLHMTCHGERKHECDECGSKFFTASKLLAHKKGKLLTVCPICGIHLKAGSLPNHVKSHESVEKRFSCEECDKKFSNRSVLTEHRRTHTGEKPYKCEECGKAFIASRKLSRHMMIHTGEKPHKCDLCHMAFNQKSNLTVHLRSHMRGKIKTDPVYLEPDVEKDEDDVDPGEDPEME